MNLTLFGAFALMAFVSDINGEFGGPAGFAGLFGPPAAASGWMVGQEASKNAADIAINSVISKVDVNDLPPELQLVLLAAIIAVSQAVVIPGAGIVAAPGYHGLGYPGLGYPGVAKVAAPLAVAKAIAPVDDYDPNPQYSYSYDINDALTGDSKSQQESRSGDVVQGSYSLVEPDGTRRIVEYTADPVQGFNAVVHKEPLVAKAVVAAPAIAKVGIAPALYPGYHAPLAPRLASPYGVPGLAYH